MSTTRRTRERRLVIILSASLLALVVAGLALRTAERRTDTVAAPAPIVPGDARRIAIERPDRAVIVLERGAADASSDPEIAARDDPGDWRVVAPCAIDAIDARIAPLLDAFAGTAPAYPAAEVDLAAAGLVAPLAIVRIDETSIRLGGTDLGGGRRYAASGEHVALVPEWVLSLVEGGLSALADPVTFPVAPARLLRRDVPPGTDGTGGASAPPSANAAPPPGATTAALDPLPWGGLAAGQVVSWPIASAPPTTRRARLEATLASGETRTHELVGNASWNALLAADGGCARLFGDADLPPDTWR